MNCYEKNIEVESDDIQDIDSMYNTAKQKFF